MQQSFWRPRLMLGGKKCNLFFKHNSCKGWGTVQIAVDFWKIMLKFSSSSVGYLLSSNLDIMDKLFPHDFKFVYLPPQPVTCYPSWMWPGYLSFCLHSSILRMCNWTAKPKPSLQMFILIQSKLLTSLAMLVEKPVSKFQFLLQWHQGSNFDTFITENFVVS